MAKIAGRQTGVSRKEETILLERLSGQRTISSEEQDYLRNILTPVREAGPNTELVAEGDDHKHVFVLLSGWACRYKLLSDGRRQVTGFILPGDFAGLRGSILPQSDVSIGTLTECRYAAPTIGTTMDLCREQPSLAMTIFWEMARIQSMLSELVISLGRRNAREKLVHLFLELHRRLKDVGLANEDGMKMPLTQEVLADTLGLSVVHVNRTLQRLKREGLLQQEAGSLIFSDMQRLEDIADFQPDYLDFEQYGAGFERH